MFNIKLCLGEGFCGILLKESYKKANAINEIPKDIISEIISVIKKYPKGRRFFKSLDNVISTKGLIIIAIITE
jgi:hypothetical protein